MNKLNSAEIPWGGEGVQNKILLLGEYILDIFWNYRNILMIQWYEIYYGLNALSLDQKKKNSEKLLSMMSYSFRVNFNYCERQWIFLAKVKYYFEVCYSARISIQSSF